MDGNSKRVRGSIGLVAALVLAVGAFGIGIASGQTSGDTFTGCLRLTGKLVKVAIGSEPTSPCLGSAVEISWNETGPRGLRGLPGQQGSPGISGYFIATTSQTHPANVGGIFTSLNANCPGGQRALGGGASALADGQGTGNFTGSTNAYVVTQDYPKADGTGWVATFDIDNSIIEAPFQMTVYAICANVQ
jgi:hypothetical protein